MLVRFPAISEKLMKKQNGAQTPLEVPRSTPAPTGYGQGARQETASAAHQGHNSQYESQQEQGGCGFQDSTAGWYEEPAHEGFISTKDFVSSGEKFDLMRQEAKVVDPDERDDDDLEETHEEAQWEAALPASVRSLAREQGVKIPTARMGTPQERQLFKENYLRPEFRSGSTSANAHEAIDFGAFADWWNAKIGELESAHDFSSGLFRKTAQLLRTHYKERERVINISTTIAQTNDDGETLREQNRALRDEHRDPARGGGCCQVPASRRKRSRCAVLGTATCSGQCHLHCLSRNGDGDFADAWADAQRTAAGDDDEGTADAEHSEQPQPPPTPPPPHCCWR